VTVSAWFVYDAPGAASGPAVFPAGAAVRDVLHMATPAAGGEAAAQPLTLRLRVPPGCVSARDVLAHTAGTACVAPSRDGAGARAVATLPGGATLRASAGRSGTAELAIAMPHAPPASRSAAVQPLVRARVLCD
jgi:hypothetical protein